MNPRLGIVSPGREPKLTIDNIVDAVTNSVNKNNIVNSLADFNLGLPIPTQINSTRSIDQIHLQEQQQPIGGIVDIAQRSPSRTSTLALHSPTSDRLTARDVEVIERENISIERLSAGKGAHGKKAQSSYKLVDMKRFLTEMGRHAPTHVPQAREVLKAILLQYNQLKQSKDMAASLNI